MQKIKPITLKLILMNFLEFADLGTISVKGDLLYDGQAELLAKKKMKNNTQKI